jgi:hypothetical protein
MAPADARAATACGGADAPAADPGHRAPMTRIFHRIVPVLWKILVIIAFGGGAPPHQRGVDEQRPHPGAHPDPPRDALVHSETLAARAPAAREDPRGRHGLVEGVDHGDLGRDDPVRGLQDRPGIDRPCRVPGPSDEGRHRSGAMVEDRRRRGRTDRGPSRRVTIAEHQAAGRAGRAARPGVSAEGGTASAARVTVPAGPPGPARPAVHAPTGGTSSRAAPARSGPRTGHRSGR